MRAPMLGWNRQGWSKKGSESVSNGLMESFSSYSAWGSLGMGGSCGLLVLDARAVNLCSFPTPRTTAEPAAIYASWTPWSHRECYRRTRTLIQRGARATSRVIKSWILEPISIGFLYLSRYLNGLWPLSLYDYDISWIHFHASSFNLSYARSS